MKPPSDAAQEAPSALFQLGQLIAAEQVPPRELLGRALEDMGYHQQMVRIANAGQQLPEEVQDALIARARDTFTSPPHVRSTAPPAVQDASRAALEDTPVRPTAPPAVQDAGRADDDSPRASSATSLRTFASPGVPPCVPPAFASPGAPPRVPPAATRRQYRSPLARDSRIHLPAANRWLPRNDPGAQGAARARRAVGAREQPRHHTPVRTTVPPAVQAAGRADVDSSSPGAPPRVPPAATRRPATEVSNLPPDRVPPHVWTREEETTLLRLVFELGANKWEDVASRLEEAPVPYQIRTASECEERWSFISAQGCPETDRETPRLTIEKYVAGQRKFALAGKSFDADAVFDDLVSHLEDDLEDDDSCKKNVRDLLLLSVKPSNAAPILAAGAVSPLVELLTDDVLVIKITAAGVVGNLAAHKPAALVEIGSAAIVPLVALVRETQASDAMGHGSRALANLSLHGDNKIKMVEAGCLDALVGVLRRGRLPAVHAACCLRNLALVDLATKDAIASAGALEPLVALALGGADDEDAKKAKEHAKFALTSLAFHPEVKPQIAVEKAKVSLKIAMAEASKAQRELSMSAAAAREGRESRMLRESETSSLQARVYELEAANASLERCLGWMAGATPDGGDAAAHRDKRAKMEAADEATTWRRLPRPPAVAGPAALRARVPLQRVRDVDPGHVEVVPHLPRDHRQDDRVPPRLGIC
ncbi:ubiquitin-protein transferase [Aureococcus anophagefferens]|nr:ubiquitin-protein transferase [Aureococcus anophagefferens]